MATIGLLGAFTSALFGYFFSLFAIGGNYTALIISGVVALVYLTLVTVRMLIIDAPWQSAALIVLDLALFTASFVGSISIWFVLACAITGIWFFIAWKSGKKAVNNMVRVRLRDLGPGFVRSSLHAILFLMIATYLSFIDPTRIAVSQALVRQSVHSVMNGVGKSAFDEILKRYPVPQADAPGLTDRVAGIIHGTAQKLIDTVPPQARTAFLIGLGIILFLLVNSFTGFVIPIVVLFLWGAISLLLRLNFITIRTEKVDKETITT